MPSDTITMPPKETITPLLLVGGGNMGRAMLEGWLASGLSPEDVTVLEPMDKIGDSLRAELSVNVVDMFDALPEDLNPKTIVFAVKPQILPGVIADYAPFVQDDTLFLSIAAGKPLAFFEQGLMTEMDAAVPAVVRAMPNTPAAIGEGMTALCANKRVGDSQKQVADFLVAAVGDSLWVEERMMDAVTAVSGSGPAYVFALIEAMTHAGVSLGLPDDVAARLATQTVKGSGMLAAKAGKSAGQLRREVTSPNGTTAAALEQLMNPADGMQPLLSRAIAAANRRSKELAG